MRVKKALKTAGKKVKDKIREFFVDEYGGNLVEYALLIGFALFIFFLIITVIMSMLDWTIGQSNEFFDTVSGLGE
jgi:Flp pilus assembly pilin Flp